MSTALSESIRRERRGMIQRRTAGAIMAIVSRFIADACRREALDAISTAVADGGFELTNRAEREQYEAWKATIITPLDSEPLAIPEKPVASAVMPRMPSRSPPPLTGM